jgi:S-(hydroxymethyl)glutathione dehydrogenase / alcohol dehydrogenase
MSRTFLAPVLPAIGTRMEMREVRLDPPGPDEVTVQMTASGICHSCLHAMDGSHGGMPTPLVLGDEGAGVVTDIGSGVEGIDVGDHVVISWAPSCGRCRFCVVGRPVLCERRSPKPGTLLDGTTRLHLDDQPLYHFGPATYSPFTVVHSSAAIPIRKDLPLELAAMIGCAVATGVGAVINTAGTRLGQSVAVFGCGGVGLNSIQGAGLIGAHPIVAVDLVDERLDLARRLGATHTVRADAPDVSDQLDAVSEGGFDVTVLAVGAMRAFEQAWAATGRGGTCVVIGRTPDGETTTFNPQTIHTGERRLIGSIYGSVRPAVDFPKFADLAAIGRLRLDEMVTTRYPVDEINDGFDALAAGQLARGLIVF